MKLYYDPETKQYYALDDCQYKCYRCGHIINSIMLVDIGWYKDNTSCHQYFCQNCFNKRLKSDRMVKIQEFKIVGIVERLPTVCIPVLPKVPELVEGRVSSTQEAAKLRSDRTVDRAWRSHIKDFMIQPGSKTAEQIDSNNRKLMLEMEQPRPMTETEMVNKLFKMAESKPLIEAEEKKRLEG
jgi:hypothetical protein